MAKTNTEKILDNKPKIYADYDPSEDEKKVRDWVYDRYLAMKDSPDRKTAEKVWEKSREQWEAKRKKEPGMADWQSDHYVPLTTSVVETALAEIVDQSPQPLILPRSPEDAPRSMVMGHVFTFTWDVANGDTELYNVEKDALICGTGIGQEYYYKDRRLVRTSSLDKNGKEVYKEDEAFDYDDCYMEAVRLEDFFIDEKARGFQGPYGARDCIRRYIMNIEDFKIFFSGPIWDPYDNAKLVRPGGDIEYYEKYKPPAGIDHKNEVEVLWYWSKKPIDSLNIIANDVVIKMGPNIYKHKQLPFARALDVKRPHSFYGKGEAELLESTNDEVNTLRRMVIDRNHLDIDKMFTGSSSLSLNDEDLIARPHGFIPTDGDENSLKPIEYGDIPRSVDMSIKMLGDDATITTGIDPRSASLPSPGTATEAAILKESALKRIRLKMRLLEREFLIDVARLRVANIIQFYSQPKLEKIVGKEDSQQYQQQIADLQSRGLLDMQGSTPYKKEYRQLRIKDKSLSTDEVGNPIEQSASGYTFFELRPEYFVPVARGGYDIKFAAGSSLPISKPLQQSKALEMYDRLVQLAMAGVGYDPVKLGDLILKVNDYNPEDFHAAQTAPGAPGGATPGQQVPEQRAQDAAKLALQENQLMMQGQEVPATPFAPPVHTQIHIEFMKSPTFQQVPKESPINQIFANHVTGELMAQQGRQAGGQPGQPQGQGLPPRPQTQTQPKGPQLVGGQQGGNKDMQATIPALIQGGGQAPSAI